MGSPFVFPPVAFGKAHPAMTRPVSGLRRTIAAVAPAKRRPPGLGNGARATTAVERRSLSLGAPSRSVSAVLGCDYLKQPFDGLPKLAARFHKFSLRFFKPPPRPNSRNRKRHRDYDQPRYDQIDDHVHQDESPRRAIRYSIRVSTRFASRRYNSKSSSRNPLFVTSACHPSQSAKADIKRATTLTNSPIPIKRFLAPCFQRLRAFPQLRLFRI